MSSKCSKSVLTSLTLAALAIPGVAQAEGNTHKPAPSSGAVPKAWYSNVINEYKYTRYQEGDNKRKNRYKIDVWQAHLVVPIKDYTVSLYAQRDSQSGASSQGPTPAFAQGETPTWEFIDSISGATIQSDRNQLEFEVDYTLPDAQYGLKLYYSSEEDNQSPGVTFLGQWNFNKNNTTLWAEAGLGRSKNNFIRGGIGALTLAPNSLTRTNTAFDVQKCYLALKQDLTKYNYAVASLEFDYFDGNLNDNYRWVAVGGDARFLPTPNLFYPAGIFPTQILPDGVTVPLEKRPGHRAIWMPMLRFVQAIPATGGALHLDYRYARDSWKIKSHMIEATGYQPFFDGWELTPKFRWYSQSRAKFYAPLFQVAPGDAVGAPYPIPTVNPGAYASDYRLSGYGTLNYELRLGYQAFSKVNVAVLGGYYVRAAKYKWGKKDPWKVPETKGSGRGAKYASIELNMKL